MWICICYESMDEWSCIHRESSSLQMDLVIDQQKASGVLSSQELSRLFTHSRQDPVEARQTQVLQSHTAHCWWAGLMFFSNASGVGGSALTS